MNTENLSRARQKTRHQLMVAAIDLISKHGYDDVSVRDITTYADYGYKTFYLYFKNKEDIALAIVEELFKQSMQYGIEQAEATETPEREYQILKYALLHHADHRVFFAKMKAPLDHQIGRQVRDVMIQFFIKLDAEDTFRLPPNADKTMSSSIMIGMIVEVLRLWANDHKDYHADEILQIFWRSIATSYK